MTDTLRRQNSGSFLVTFLPSSLIGASARYCQRALVDKLGMTSTQMVKSKTYQTMVAVHATPCKITPSKQ
jgi:hypothetical protein